MVKKMRFFIIIFMPIFLSSCYLSETRVSSPKKTYKRYFGKTDEFAYSIKGPLGHWSVFAPKYKNKSAIFFDGQLAKGVAIDVSFQVIERKLEWNDAESMQRDRYFFKNKTYPDLSENKKIITVGHQNINCIKNPPSDNGRHLGPSKDPAISGKWAGKGVTMYYSEVGCPFHYQGKQYYFFMSKILKVNDSHNGNISLTDRLQIDLEVDKLFEPVWESIIFSSKISQAPLTEPTP